jgi:hypothetical protein
MSNWVRVNINGVTYDALTHALIAIGFKPTSGRPYQDEIDKVWRQARKDLKKHSECHVNKSNQTYTITLAH